jgi:hypothetical protein
MVARPFSSVDTTGVGVEGGAVGESAAAGIGIEECAAVKSLVDSCLRGGGGDLAAW